MPTDSASTRMDPHSRHGQALDALIACVVLAIVAAIVAGLAWSRPITAASSIAYNQSGRLSYSAATPPDSIYGGAVVTTGQPVYGSAVTHVSVDYRYRLQAGSLADVTGTEQLVAKITNPDGLSRSVPVQATPVHFTGAGFSAVGTLQLSSLAALVSAFNRASGAGFSSENFPVTISPSVAVHGLLGGQRFSSTFSSPIEFTYSLGNLLPGGSSASGGRPSFTSSTTGSVALPEGKPATLPLGIPVAVARTASLVALIVALFLGGLAGWPLLRRATSKDEHERISARFASLIVEADGVTPVTGVTVVELASFDDVLQVAKRLECPIVHWGEGGDVYAVVDSGTLYRYLSVPPWGSEFCGRPAANGSGWVRGQSVALSPPDATVTEEARRDGNGVVAGQGH